MTVKDLRTLVDNLDEYIRIPGGIERLKRTILHLAVSGQLVPQDPSEGTGEELYQQIQSEKQKLIVDGKLKKQKPLPEIGEDEIPFKIPKTWKWARLNDIYDVRDGTHDTPKYVGEGVPLVTSKNLSSGKLNFTKIKYISKKDHEAIKIRSEVNENDILFAMIGSIGNPVIVDTDTEFSIKNVALFKPYKSHLYTPQWLLAILKIAESDMKEKSAGGVQSFVSLGFVRNYPVPLPPLVEQRRIVKKVESIFTLIDVLAGEYQLEQQERSKLVKSSLGKLAKDQNHLALDLLTDIIKTKQDAAELRKTILHLAVSGQLVPQDPSEGTGEELYQQIQAEKQKLIAEGKIKKQKPLPEITEDEIPFQIPNSWKWVRIPETYRSITPASKIKTSEMQINGRFPVVDQGQSYIAGYIDAAKITQVTKPIVVFGDHTREVKLIDFSFVAGADGVKILEPFLLDSEYFYLLVKVFNPQTRGYGRHFKLLNQSLVPLCPVAEQERIGRKTTELLGLVTQLEKQMEGK